jgi:hypothetical protein
MRMCVRKGFMTLAWRSALLGLAFLTLCRGQSVLSTVAGDGTTGFSGDGGPALAPGSGGLNQVAIQVPLSLADGSWPIQASIGGVASPSGVVLTVQQ